MALGRVALAGLVLIIEPWNLENAVSGLLALAGAFCWAAGSIAVKILRRRHEVDLLSLTGWQTFYGSILLLLIAVFVESDAPEWTSEFVWSLVFTLVMTTCVASFIWLYVLRELPAGIAGLGTMATPVVGLLASWAQLGEQPTAPEVVGMIVILMGMAILFARGMKSTAPVPVGGLATGEGNESRMRIRATESRSSLTRQGGDEVRKRPAPIEAPALLFVPTPVRGAAAAAW